MGETMSAFILKIVKKTSYTHTYMVVRMDEKFRIKNVGTQVNGFHNGYRFISDGCPAVSPRDAIFMRGVYKDRDTQEFTVAFEYVPEFEKAVLGFNEANSNNKNLEIGDVILGRE
jgi:hypothetical protein